MGAFTGRKLRQFPPRFGTCQRGESLAAPEVYQQGLALLRALNFFGVSQVEFKRIGATGNLKLIEVNGRFWKWHSLATACGVNLAALVYQDLTGQKPQPQDSPTGRDSLDCSPG